MREPPWDEIGVAVEPFLDRMLDLVPINVAICEGAKFDNVRPRSLITLAGAVGFGSTMDATRFAQVCNASRFSLRKSWQS